MKYIYTFLGLFLMSHIHATIRRVKANEFTSGNGGSWSQAYPGSSLQTVINLSAPGDEVWLAQGTYQPATNAAYAMKSGVKIYGGYAGLYNGDVTRDIKLYPTTLKGNGFVVFNNQNVSNQAVLDGVTIRDGQNTQPGYQGGGMYNSNSSPQISNVYFYHNVCDGGGGGMCNVNSSPKLTNVVFEYNITGRGEGGAIYNDSGSPSIENAVFYNNMAPSGGAVSNNDGSNPYFYNCLFYKNFTYANGFGGAIENNSSLINIFNSTFVGNYCTKDGIGGAVHSYKFGSQTTEVHIANCVFWNNYDTLSGSAVRRVDISVSGSPMDVSYSYFKETNTFSGAGNVTSTSTIVFKNVDNPIGADQIWMTADDGLRPDFCKSSAIIDKGNNNSTPVSIVNDIAQQTRRVRVGFITPEGGPTTVDMGAYEAQESLSKAELTGSIGSGHTIPFPQELFPDYITNTTLPNPTAATITRWERRVGTTGSWSSAGGLSPADSIGLRLPLLIPNITPYNVYFRRIVSSASYCNAEYASDSVLIHVATAAGTVGGKVVSLHNSPVQDVIIRLERITSNLPGSPNGKVYIDTTDSQGGYNFPFVYFGDPDVPSSAADFKITASKGTHRISRNLDFTLNVNNRNKAVNDFIDSTGYSVEGRTFQSCSDCVVSGTCPIDSVDIWRSAPGVPVGRITQTGYLNGVFGKYSVQIDDPGGISIEPRFTGHVFTNSPRSFTLTNDTTGIDFQDVTTHTITGRLTAGCGEFVGRALLEFYDSLPKNATGRARPQECFKKRVQTDVNGNYTITLPARPYKVRVISFTPSGPTSQPVQETDVMNFVNRLLPADSVYRNITTRDTVLNITFQRSPVIRIVQGLNVISCPGNSILGDFSRIEQAKAELLRIKVYQGLPTVNNGLGCVVSDTNRVTLLTNIPSNSMTNVGAVSFRPADTGVVVIIKGGSPNVTGDHFKSLQLNFTDKYNRSTSFSNPRVLVTGVRQDEGANFLTVAPPKIPMLVLHDPPGDQSYSYWNSSTAKQTAFRMYAASGRETGGWLEVKLGTKLSTGIFVSTESEFWLSATGEIKDTKTNTSATEQIYTHKYSTELKTSDSKAEVGPDGDVYVGMALNLIYTSAREVSLQGCLIKDTTTMIFAPGGVPTEFRFSEKQLKNVVIPSLLNQITPSTSQLDRDSIMNVVGQWRQMIANNAINKEQAKSTGQNITFNGGGSGSGSSLTTTISDINTTEFSLTVDKSLAIAAGFEVAGSGLSGGASVSFKVETGESTVQDITTEVTTGYELKDASSGDQFTVNIKEDRLSATPVFELLAGQASCPSEEGTQIRDQPQLSAPITVAADTNNAGIIEYKLLLGNPSPISTDASRSFNVYLDATSNSEGAEVSINNNPVTNANATVPITVIRNQQQQVIVRVKRITTSPVYSYTGLAIIATDGCSSPLAGDIADTVFLSAYFTAPCSSITLEEPGDNWVQAGNDYTKRILVKNYDATKISTVKLQYAIVGSNDWTDALPTLTPADLNSNAAIGTSFYWNTTGLADGRYNIRLKLTCPSGTIYSEKKSGIIDHTAPTLLGRPSPTDDNYVNGDVISFSYTEAINTTNLNSGTVTMTRLNNGAILPITVSGYENQLVIVPVSSITGFVGETIRVIVKNLSDANGNIKTIADTSYFLVGTTTVATGTNAMTVSIAQPRVYKNSDSTINITFRLPVAATDSTRVNYTVGGTARYGIDYTIEYTGYQPNYTFNNGSQGALRLPKTATEIGFRIRPIADTGLALDKTIIISLSEGGNYDLGAATSVTGTITSDDGVYTYTFMGTGNFSTKANWLNSKKPLTTLAAGKTIIINPSGTCTLDVPLTIKSGATIRVAQNRSFIIPGNLKFN